MSGDRYKIDNQESVYFLTLTVVGWLDVFTRIEYKDVIVESLAWCQKEKGLTRERGVKMKNAKCKGKRGIILFRQDFSDSLNKLF